MFLKTGMGRQRVSSYYEHEELPCLNIHYVYSLELPEEADAEYGERIDLEVLEFEDFELRDLFLAELDSGKLFLIDRAKIRGLK